MKKVSAKEFFTVLWSGLRQTLRWFFGLFGYKGDGNYAKCVWGLFATSVTAITCIIAIMVVYGFSREVTRWYNSNFHDCDSPYCYENTYISRDIYFHDHGDGKGYIYNLRTGEKLIKHVEWIAKPLGKDSLICFSNGKKRGYFSKYTGKVIVEPKYDHAWIFSEGKASVEENGIIKFIDASGKVVIDKNLAYFPNMDGYVFHGGYCIVCDNNERLYGLMDKSGEIVLPLEYRNITTNDDFTLWVIAKEKEMGVLDKNLKPIFPLMESTIYVGDGTIDITMPDHTIHKYDAEGNLIHDFYIVGIRALEYEKDEICYRKVKNNSCDSEDEEEDDNITYESYHPEATARLRAYIAGDNYEGLMTADGQVVTMPMYKDIDAIGDDLYLCTSTNYDKVILNGKGEIVSRRSEE